MRGSGRRRPPLPLVLIVVVAIGAGPSRGGRRASRGAHRSTWSFLVNDEASPGTYRSENTSNCYWARLSGTDGSLESIIANNFGGARQFVTISGSDMAFETSGCGERNRV